MFIYTHMASVSCRSFFSRRCIWGIFCFNLEGDSLRERRGRGEREKRRHTVNSPGYVLKEASSVTLTLCVCVRVRASPTRGGPKGQGLGNVAHGLNPAVGDDGHAEPPRVLRHLVHSRGLGPAARQHWGRGGGVVSTGRSHTAVHSTIRVLAVSSRLIGLMEDFAVGPSGLGLKVRKNKLHTHFLLTHC